MDEDVEVQLLDFRCHDVRDDLLDGLCSQPDLAEAAVPELADDEVVAVLLVLLDADDLPVLLALLDVAAVPVLLVLLDVAAVPVLLVLLYNDVADAQFESLDVFDELVDVVGLDVGCRCQPLRSRCHTLLLADVGTILLHSHIRLDDMDVLLPNLDTDDDLDAGPNDVLNVSNVDPDVANVVVDANAVVAGSEVAHRCRFRSRR